MSRQSKQRKTFELARQLTALHLRGERGPKATTPKHGKNPKRRLYAQDATRQARLAVLVTK